MSGKNFRVGSGMVRFIGSAVLALCSAAALFAAGAADTKAAAPAGGVNPAGQLPIVKDQITISVFRTQDPLILDFEENYQTKWMQEKTNIKVNWMLTPAQQINERLNLMLAAGTDLPDVFMTYITNPTLQRYGQEKIFIPLNSYVKDYSYELKTVIKDLASVNVDFMAAYTAPDGNIYGLPQVNTCRWCETIYRAWVDKRWLERLGLPMPTTTDEFVALLRAFKTKDPNKNGVADEIPMMGGRTGWGAQVEGFLMFPFIVYNPGDRLILNKETGKVTAAYMQPEYLEGLRFIRGLIQEGLLDPISVTQTNQEHKVMGEAVPEKVGVHLGSNQTWLNLSDKKYEFYEAITPLKGVKTGKPQTYRNAYQTLADAIFAISKTAKNPAAAFRWADFQYSYDNSMLSRYAKEGEDWVKADPGTKGPFGHPAVFREVGNFGRPTKNSNRQMFQYLSYDLLNGLQMTDSKGVAVNSDAYYVLRTPKYADNAIGNSVPRVFIDPKLVDEYGELRANLNTYVAESFARFVTGDLALTQWDSFQAELKRIGVDRFIQLTQEAYQRQYMKK
jgi:putative aldouronate transport system substrate-binding protein